MTIVLYGLAVATLLTIVCMVGVFTARREFDKLTRQRDGIPFVAFEDCHIDRFGGRVYATVHLRGNQRPDTNETVFMHINGIMTEMSVSSITWTYGSDVAECHLQDLRSRTRDVTVP